MDPNVLLDAIRDLVKKGLDDAFLEDTTASEALDLFQDLSEKIDNLDHWLSNHGFLPREWVGRR